MRKITLLFTLCLLTMGAFAQTPQTFSANGTDSENFVLTILPSDITVNGADPITAMSLTNFVSHYDTANGGTNWCPDWYNFKLDIVGGVADGTSVTGCSADFEIADILGFTSIMITSLQTDTYNDVVFINVDVNVTFTASSPPNCDAMLSNPVDGETAAATDGDITWNAAGGAPIGYNLTVGTTTGGSDVLATTDVGNVTAYSLGALAQGTMYYVNIEPYNNIGSATGCTEYSFMTFTPPSNDLCSSPEVVTVGEGTCGPTVTGNNTGATDSGEPEPAYGYYSGGDIWYQFVVPAGQTQVNIEIATSVFSTTILAVYNTSMACGSLVEEYSVNAYTGSNIAVAGLTAGDTYLLRMYDWSNDNFGDVTFCLSTPPSCLAPTTLTATNIMETSVDIGWTEAGTASTYNVEWGTSPLTQGAGTMITGTTNNPESLTGLTPSTAYSFYVQADCGGGDLSDWSGPFSFTTNGPPPANDDCAGAENIVPSTTGAEVWSIGTTANTTASGEIASGDTSCLGFGAGREVWYTVEVPAAGDITIQTRAVAGSPLADTVMSVFSGTCGALVGTEIQCDDDGGDGNFSLITLTGQTAGDMLYVRVWEYGNPATNGLEDGAFEIAAYAADPTLLSIQDFYGGLVFNYYPNPVNNTLVLKAQKDIDNISVYNMLGQEVLRTAPNAVNTEVHMSALQSGAYFVKVTIGSATETVRIMKN